MTRALPLFRGPLLPTAALLVLATALLARLLPGAPAPGVIMQVGLLLTGGPLVARSLAGVARGHFAADLVASLAIVAAILLGEPLPGLIVVLMQTGGEALERYAEGRASHAVRELEAAAPRFAHRLRPGAIDEIAAAELQVGDIVLVRPGELVPCDGTVLSGESHVDASTLTGEPVPRRAGPGSALMSGSVNGEGALTVRATRTSAESRYARIVELVRSAQASKAPIQRVADRYAVWFTPLTLLVCALAYLISHDPLRVLAVLVVATPCPLILATPVAIVGGINRAARRQIIVRDGGALERLATVDSAAFDKTGTLTHGVPLMNRVLAAEGHESSDVLRAAASLQQASGHLLGRAVVRAAREAGLTLVAPSGVRERAGRGIGGTVAGQRVLIGSRGLVLELHPTLRDAVAQVGSEASGLHAYVVIDDVLAGVLEFADRPRAGMRRLLADLAALGVRRTLLLSGDHSAHVQRTARELGITEAHGDLLPEDKVTVVRRLLEQGHAVMMVGDGVNDAPALTAATVGVAIASRGGGITAEAADVIILVDEPLRVTDAVCIAQRTLRIARQSIGVGIGLSGCAMLLAAAGYVPPTIGALLQELIDIAVIVNALRAAAPPGQTAPRGGYADRQDAVHAAAGAAG